MSGFLDNLLPWAWTGFQIMLSAVICITGFSMMTNLKSTWLKILGVIVIAAGICLAWPIIRSLMARF